MTSPANLRVTEIVAVHLTSDESRDLEAGLRNLNPGGTGLEMVMQKVQSPEEHAKRILRQLNGGGWLELSNPEVHVAMHAVVGVNYELVERFRDASKSLERMDAAAHYPSYRGADWSEAREAALRNAEFSCAECGETDSLHVHHQIPYRLFNTAADANDADNLEVLCASCHGSISAE